MRKTTAVKPPQDEERSGTFVTALARGLDVMKAFTGQHQQMTLAELARIVSLPRATVRRCLLTLESLGYVTSVGRYFALSPQVLVLAQAFLSSNILTRVTQPFLERISQTLNEPCSVSILRGNEVIYVVRSSRRRIGSLYRDVGAHMPAHATSMGRVLLAHLLENEQDHFFATTKLEAFTHLTITDEKEMRRVLAKVRRDHYAIIDQEMEIGLRTLAVPLQNTAGHVVAAMNVSTNAGRVSRKELLDRHLGVLREAAHEIRSLLVT